MEITSKKKSARGTGNEPQKVIFSQNNIPLKKEEVTLQKRGLQKRPRWPLKDSEHGGPKFLKEKPGIPKVKNTSQGSKST